MNGQPTSFQISDVPTGDTFACKSDPSGGTDLKLLPQVLAVGSPAMATGVETQAIQLGFSDTVTGANLASFEEMYVVVQNLRVIKCERRRRLARIEQP